MGRPVTRGVLVKEEHVETLKRLPARTMDAVLGAAFRAAIGESAALAVKDPTGILEAMVQSIAVAAQKFDENEVERKAKDAERKRKEREMKEKKAILKMLEARSGEKNHVDDDEIDDEDDENPDARKTLCDMDGENCDTLDGSVAMSRGQKRTNADKSGQKRMKADKGGQKRTKAESAQKERKKEGKNIYTPIVPKGDVKGDSLPAAIDVDELLGGGGGRDGARPSLAEVAAGMAEVHPNASDTDAFPRTLARYLKKNGAAEGGEEELLKKIAAAHSRWIESGAWDAEGGRYAPKLKNWLWGGNWKQEPPERREEDGRDGARPSRDEGFHAGASL